MKEKHGVTGVIFSEKDGKRLFLLLHRVLNWKGWEFCKGGIDGDEKPEQAVLREIREEAGLSRVSIVSSLPQKFSWTAKDMRYIYTPFIVRADLDEPVVLQTGIVEHDSFKWAPEGEAESLLFHEDNKSIFREALALLNRR